MTLRRTAFLVVCALALTACSLPGLEPARRSVVPTNTAQAEAIPPTQTSAPATDAVPLSNERGEEAIMIVEPGPGSRLTSPFKVRGMAGPTFEQTLVARLVDADGSILTEQALMIQAPMGERGPFEGELDVAVSVETNVFLQVYATSPRDGGITHLETVGGGITLVPDGPQEIVERSPYSERITIHVPASNQQISGGLVHVEGFGVASFEGTLVLELYDAEGAELGVEPIIVESPDMGTPGRFSGNVAYSISEPMPARLVVRDPLPTANGVNHIASLEVRLGP